MATLTGGQILAEAMLDRGIEHIFTLCGESINPVYRHLINTPVKFYDTRHEQSAVFMAEACGRLIRKPGIALVTAGPGFTNSLSAVANAYMANAPLVLISGSAGLMSIEKMDIQDMRQSPMIEPVVKKAFVCHKTERIAEFFDMAYRTAISGRPGPVYLEVPVDVLKSEVDSKLVKRPHTCVVSRPVDKQSVGELIYMLDQSQKPLFIAGSGCWYADAADDLKSLVERTGIPIFTAMSGRGVISDIHPLCFGASSSIRPGAALFAMINCDLAVLLGTRMNIFTLFGDLFQKATRIVQVDIHGDEIGRNRTVDLAVVSDVRGFLEAGNRLLQTTAKGEDLSNRFSGWVAELKTQAEISRTKANEHWFSDAVPIHPMRLCHEVNQFMDREDDIVVGDGGDTQIWMSMTRTARRPGHMLEAGMFGCLGVGLPYANTAKLLNPEKRVCLVVGDGSIGFNFMEFESSIRNHTPIVAVISNDRGWGMIRHSQEITMGQAIDAVTWIGSVPYHRLVESLGGKGYYIEKAEDIRPALADAFASGMTCCLNVMTDPTTISPGSVALANLGSFVQ